MQLLKYGGSSITRVASVRELPPLAAILLSAIAKCPTAVFALAKVSLLAHARAVTVHLGDSSGRSRHVQHYL
jgi:hypothetical protein